MLPELSFESLKPLKECEALLLFVCRNTNDGCFIILQFRISRSIMISNEGDDRVLFPLGARFIQVVDNVVKLHVIFFCRTIKLTFRYEAQRNTSQVQRLVQVSRYAAVEKGGRSWYKYRYAGRYLPPDKESQ